MLCAIVQTNLVIDVLELTESQLISYARVNQAVVDVTDFPDVPEIGWTFDGTTFIPPVDYEPVKIITKLALRNRFTYSEKIALQTALASSIPLQVWFADYEVSTFVDLARPDTIAGITYLETAGLIASGRASQILNNPIQFSERPLN